MPMQDIINRDDDNLTSNITNSGRVAHVFDDQFRDFVRMKAWMIFLIPSLEAYSNNPHKNGTLPKTLYYQFLDAVDKQPDSWRANQLAPVQIEDNSTALQAYRGTMGELLKHQRSHLCTLQLLTNILETQRIAVKGKVPNCKKMITTIYEDLPPNNEKMTTLQIKNAEIVLAKDTELFSHHLGYGDIPKDSLTVPTLADIWAAMSSSASGEVPV
ncbi:hypothetical protein PCANC_00933 [Puccinia coronata f. sp. avenae]|uniref:Uncharacterized protein n=1 Tax=Puccinia coronata f. sp. avenae TaxID=200324 RepID=A0A2N5T7Z8_9BASI|nr:hypothetical protein PCANC_03953 [Puccinia coronata f. sp. avenae]PLW57891.1 hypothetical protein PCANC_00933 [Puccinia coronata f. sp. avenae]